MNGKKGERSMKVTRRQAVIGLGAAGIALSAPAIVRAQGTQRYLKPIVAGLNAKEGDPTYESIARIGPILKEKYDVDMEIRLYPSSTLGTDLSLMEAVRTGFVDITSNATLQFQGVSPALSFIDLPYAVTDWDMGLRLFKSDLWAQQAKKFEEEANLVVLPPVGGGGFRMLLNNVRPLPAPDKVGGLKIRTTQSPADVGLIKTWGGNPTPIAWTETYNSLKTGLVEGMHVQPIWVYAFKMHEVLKYATHVDALFAVQLQVMNKNSFMSMPQTIRDKFMMAAVEAAEQANQMDRDLESKMTENLTAAGMEIYQPTAAEKKAWQEKGEALWGELAGTIDPGVIESMRALRA
jgi:TRAP-type C4-dicarboxylate transport system substrate-binding protein